MRAEQFMVRDVQVCSPESTLHEAAGKMWKADVGSVVVVDANRRPVGIITDRDICMAAFTQGVALPDSKVSSAMSKRVLTCRRDTPLRDVEGLMRDAQIRRVPVVDGDGRLAGIVSLGDVVHALEPAGWRNIVSSPGVARTLAAITEKRWIPSERRPA